MITSSLFLVALVFFIHLAGNLIVCGCKCDDWSVSLERKDFSKPNHSLGSTCFTYHSEDVSIDSVVLGFYFFSLDFEFMCRKK
jgi:hypothetical protein